MSQYFLIPLFQHKDEIIKINKAKFIIGRESNCDCYIPDDSISREHSFIFIENDDIFVEDNNSSNGTYVNDIKIAEKTKLKEGYTIRLANLVFQISTNLPEKVLFYEGDYKINPESIKDSKSLINYLLSEKELIDIISTMLLKYNDVEKIFTNILNFALKMLKADRGVLLTKENNKFIPKVSSNIVDEFNSINTLSKSIVDYVVEKKQPVIINNPVFNARFMGKSLLQFQIESSLCSPIYIGEEIAAILYIDNREEKKQFTTYDYALFLSFISHCQNILFNAKKNEKLLEDLLAQSVVNRWDEINRVKEKVVTQFNENIIRPLNVLTKEIDTLNNDEILSRFKKTYKEVVENIDGLNINIDVDKSMAILTTVNLKAFVKNIFEEVDDYIKLNNIETTIIGEDIFVETYKIQLSQVIKNLLLFLIKVLSRNSEIKISFSLVGNIVQFSVVGCEKSKIIESENYFNTIENKRMLEMVTNLLKGMNCKFKNSIVENCINFDFEFSNNDLEVDNNDNVKQENRINKNLLLLSLENKTDEENLKTFLENLEFKITTDHNLKDNAELKILEINEGNLEKYHTNCSNDCNVIVLIKKSNNEFLKRVNELKPYSVLELPVNKDKLLETIKMVLSVTDAERDKIKEMKDSLVKDLVATMKHEINNPLQIINMNLELVENSENKKRIEKIKESAKRIGQLIEDLSSLNDFELVKYANSNRNIITPKNKRK